jgi:hypothetical protein
LLERAEERLVEDVDNLTAFVIGKDMLARTDVPLEHVP